MRSASNKFMAIKKRPIQKKPKAPQGLLDVMRSIKKGAEIEAPQLPVIHNLKGAIRRPRLTEKAANLSSQNVYTFDVATDATKQDIIRTVRALYKVTPRKVTVVNTIGKRVRLRARRGFGTKNKSRKAYIFLKKGDVIDFAA